MECKRKLTEKEIKSIVSTLTLPNGRYKPVADNSLKRIKKLIIEDLRSIEIYPKVLPHIKKKITSEFFKSMISPGDCVGILMAEHIGSKGTQDTLNTFHKAGLTVESVQGMPRVNELLNVTKNPRAPICNFTLKKNPESLQECRNNCMHLEYVTIGTLMKSTQLLHNMEEEPWYSVYENFNSEFRDIEGGKRMRIKFDYKMLFRHKVTLVDIAEKINKVYSDFKAVPSPSSLFLIDVFFTYVQDHYEDIEIYFRDHILPTIASFYIHGIQDIKEIYYIEEDGEWKITSKGTNLIGLMQNVFIDSSSVISSDMWETLEYLGIEATREYLLNEFMTMLAGDSYLDKRHISLLVDIITNKGTLSAVNRYGIDRNIVGPLAKASFEESLNNFMQAGANQEVDNCVGCSAAIMVGKIPQNGTGMCELIYKP